MLINENFQRICHEIACSLVCFTLRVIPVIDVLNGVVVHAVRGMREKYRPLESALCRTANPLDVASTFRSLGFRELYVADLDAILGGRLSLSLWRQLRTTGLVTMVDAGTASLTNADALLATGVSRVVIGTETLTYPNFLREAIDRFGSDRIRLSLDMRNGRLLTRSDKLEGSDLLSAYKLFRSMGVTSFIVLDLARVGSLEGFDAQLLETLIKTNHGEIFVGGGIRDLSDLKKLEGIGVQGALIATSLHSGVLTIQQLENSNFMA